MGYVADGKDWQDAAKDAVRPFTQMRLAQLSKVLGDREWLEGCFTIGDLLMIDVLRAVPEDELVAAHPNLAAYVERGHLAARIQGSDGSAAGSFREA